MLCPAALVALLVVGTSSCAFPRYGELKEFRPVAAGDCQLEIQSYSPVLVPGAELLARYVLTNVSGHAIRGCVSARRQWTFVSTQRTISVERTSTHRICTPEGRFRLQAGEAFSWLDAVTVPDVGAGEVQVAMEMEVVPFATTGRSLLGRSSSVQRSFTLRLEAIAGGEVRQNDRRN